MRVVGEAGLFILLLLGVERHFKAFTCQFGAGQRAQADEDLPQGGFIRDKGGTVGASFRCQACCTPARSCTSNEAVTSRNFRRRSAFADASVT